MSNQLYINTAFIYEGGARSCKDYINIIVC